MRNKWNWVMAGLIALGFVLVFIGVERNKLEQQTQKDQLEIIGLENQAYNHTMVCIASVSPTQRTPDYVKSCYEKAEKHTGHKMVRYGHGQVD